MLFTVKELIECLEGETENYEGSDEGELIGRYQLQCEECDHPIFLRKCQDRSDHFVHTWKTKSQTKCTKRSSKYSKSEIDRQINLQSRYRLGYFQKRFEYYIAVATYQALCDLEIPLLMFRRSTSKSIDSFLEVLDLNTNNFFNSFRSLAMSLRNSKNTHIQDLRSGIRQSLQEFYESEFKEYENEEEDRQKAKRKFVRDIFLPIREEMSFYFAGMDDFEFTQRCRIALDTLLHCRHAMSQDNINALIASHLIIVFGNNIKTLCSWLPSFGIDECLNSGILPIEKVVFALAALDEIDTPGLDSFRVLREDLKNLYILSCVHKDKKWKTIIGNMISKYSGDLIDANSGIDNVIEIDNYEFNMRLVKISLLLANTNLAYNQNDSAEDHYEEYYKKTGWIYVAWGKTLNDRWRDFNKDTDSVKIGKTRDWIEREDSLQNPLDVPGDVKILDAFVVTDMGRAEDYVHRKLSEYRISNQREIFAINRLVAVKMVEQLVEQFANQKKPDLRSKSTAPKGFA